jgi:hypothetical protein
VNKLVVGVAAGSFLVAAAIGSTIAFESASSGAVASSTPPPGATGGGGSVGQAPAVPAGSTSCTIGQAGNDVQVTLTAADAASACGSLAQLLARSSGGFWQDENPNVALDLVCVMTKDGTSATVMDGGGEILGHSLCSGFEANGWTEDTATEQRLRQAAQASQAAASAQAQRAAQVDAAQRAFTFDLTTLRSDADFSSVLGSVQGDVKQTARDFAQEKSDAAQGGGDQCTNASSTVYNDAASTIYNDEQSSLLNDANQVSIAVAAIRKDEQTIGGDLQALDSLGASAPSDPSSAEAAANQVASQAISQTNAAIDTVAGYVATAYQVADGMATGACSSVTVPGSPPSPPAHLS